MFLRRVEAYVAAWEANLAAAGTSAALEPGPFPIRVQTAEDLEAARFDLLAWEDPCREDGPASPFWVQSGMVQGLLERDGEPLTAMAADGASVEGLRLLCGDLVVKVEYRGAVVQVVVRGVDRFPEDGAIRVEHSFGLRMPLSARRILDSIRLRQAVIHARDRLPRPAGPGGTPCVSRKGATASA